MPRSLAGRLLAISALTTVAVLAFAAFAIGHVLERFVIRSLDQQLDAEVTMLARAVRADGTLDRTRVVNLPTFEQTGQGWGWRVESPRGHWTGGDAILTERTPRFRPPSRRARGPGLTGASPGEGSTGMGEPVHTRTLLVPTALGDVTIIAGGPRRLAVAPLREAMVPLIVSLALLGVGLAISASVQLRYGLRPLHALQASLTEVRAGRARRVPADQPYELTPLAAELNALVDQNEEQLSHARRHVANLAHGLKTPLAALGVKLAQRGHDPDGSLRAMVADIDGRVRHHLGRARATAPGSGHRACTALAPAIDGLVAVMRGIHADRGTEVTSEVAQDLSVAADPQDVDEMLGNLLDNACRYAQATVRIEAVLIGRSIRISIEDDGPGMPAEVRIEALLPGRRLDERGDGHGFGLPIAQELAELNGGSLTLGSARLGGLLVNLVLPAGDLSS
jgi:signal transduction histidine kinase